MEPFRDVYQLNKRIDDLRMHLLALMYDDGERCINFDMATLKQVGDLRVELDALLLARSVNVKQCYAHTARAVHQLTD